MIDDDDDDDNNNNRFDNNNHIYCEYCDVIISIIEDVTQNTCLFN